MTVTVVMTGTGCKNIMPRSPGAFSDGVVIMLASSGISYHWCFDTAGCTVSVDNIRIKFTYKYQHYSFDRRVAVPSVVNICHLLESLSYQCQDESAYDTEWSYHDFFKIGAYSRVCRVFGGKLLEPWSCAVLIGRYCFDSQVKLVAPEAVFDFNPNKVPPEVVSRLLGLLRGPAVSVGLVRYDVAFDFPLPRSEVHLIRDNRRGYRLFDEGGAVTEYQGARGSHGAVKIYDKTKESGLDVDVTRCEITVSGDFCGSHAELFPRLICFADVQTNLSMVNLPFEVQACIMHPDLLPVLRSTCHRNTYSKFAKMIDSLFTKSLTHEEWTRVDRFIRCCLLEFTGLRSGGVTA